LNYWHDETGTFISVRDLLRVEPGHSECWTCVARFKDHCAQAKDVYYTCGCDGTLCVPCHTNAEERQAEAAFHYFHSA